MLGDLGRRLVLGEGVGVVEGVVYKVEQSVKLPNRERQKALHGGKVGWGGVGARNAELGRRSCNSPRRVVSMGTGGSARQSRHVRTDLLLFLRHLDWLGRGATGKSGWDECGTVLGCYVAELRNRKGHCDEAERYINKRKGEVPGS